MKTRVLSLLIAALPLFGWAGVNTTGVSGDDDIPTVMDIREFRKLELGTEARMVMLYDTVMFVGDNDIYIRGDACAALCLRNTKLDVKKGMVLTGTLVGVRGDDNGMPLLLPSERTSDGDVTCSSFYELGDHVYTFDELNQKEDDIDTETLEDIAGVSGDDGILMVQDIREFRKLELGTEARMVMLYDTVMFVGGNDIYIRGEACSAICLRNTKLDVKKGMVLKGSLVGVRGDDNGVPLFLPTERTNDEHLIVNQTFDMSDREVTFEELFGGNGLSDVVIIKDVTLDSLQDNSGSRVLYAIKKEQRIPVVDLYGVVNKLPLPARCPKMQSILGVHDSNYFLIPVTDLAEEVIPLGIVNTRQNATKTENDALFDLQGRWLGKTPTHGLYIQNGKKIVK